MPVLQDTVDVEMVLHHQTDEAIKVSINGDEQMSVWLPKSMVDFEKVKGTKAIVNVTMPTWKAKNLELI